MVLRSFDSTILSLCSCLFCLLTLLYIFVFVSCPVLQCRHESKLSIIVVPGPVYPVVTLRQTQGSLPQVSHLNPALHHTPSFHQRRHFLLFFNLHLGCVSLTKFFQEGMQRKEKRKETRSFCRPDERPPRVPTGLFRSAPRHRSVSCGIV